MKKKEKPTSVRLGDELSDELENRCSDLGCSKSDFIKNAVEYVITNESDFDFGVDEEVEEPKPIVTITEITTKDSEHKPVMAHGKILDDEGNVIGTF